jgi:hypothetical protein
LAVRITFFWLAASSTSLGITPWALDMMLVRVVPIEAAQLAGHVRSIYKFCIYVKTSWEPRETSFMTIRLTERYHPRTLCASCELA